MKIEEIQHEVKEVIKANIKIIANTNAAQKLSPKRQKYYSFGEQE